jgi:hypothetical protein
MAIESIVDITVPAPVEVLVSGINMTTIIEDGGGGVVPGDYGDIVVDISGWSLDPSVVTPFARTYLDETTAAGVKGVLGLDLVNNTPDNAKPVSTPQATALSGKVDKVGGYGLSKNDFTDILKTKLDGLGGSTLIDVTASPWSLDPTGATDNSAKLATAISSNAGKILFFPAGTYKLNTEVKVNTNNVTILGSGKYSTTFISDRVPSSLSDPSGMITLEDATGFHIESIGFNNNKVSATQYVNNWCLGVYLGLWDTLSVPAVSCKNLTFRDLYFTGVNASVCGLKIIAHRSGFGGTVSNVLIEHCHFKDLGAMATEFLGESDGTVWYSHFQVRNCLFENLGTVLPYGMGVSFSGYSHSNIVDGCVFDGCANIGAENAGADYTVFSNNTFKNLKTGCKPWTVNGGDGLAFQKTGNRVTNNVVMDTSPEAPQYIAQTNLISVGNKIKCTNYTIMDNVDSSRFIGDEYIVTGTNGKVVLLQNGSTLNVFIGCRFEYPGTTTFTYMLEFNGAGTVYNRIISGCEMKWGVAGGNILQQVSSAANNTYQQTFVNGIYRFLAQHTTTERDALSSPPYGMMIINTTTNKINFRAASAWEAITSA